VDANDKDTGKGKRGDENKRKERKEGGEKKKQGGNDRGSTGKTFKTWRVAAFERTGHGIF